ncbi:MAG TPA: hypothetical protein VH475_24310 [Tepidisphaeraceae bacterium]
MRRPLPFILALIALSSICRAQPAEVNRILRTFDFEERRLGNAEDLPMNWNKADGHGLPHYVNGRLATDRARSGKYSFRFDLNGGSLIYRYDPGRIRVQQGAHYLVEAYVQTTRLTNARARLTAYLVDLDGNAIRSTIQQSEPYAARAEDDPWHKLSVEVSADSPKAASLVIELGLLQPQFYAANTLGKRTLFTQDVRGSAWFDDVRVSQVPRVRISTDRPGNIFRREDPLRLQVLVSDRFTDDLAARLLVRDAESRLVYQHSGALDISTAQSLGTGRKRLWVVLPDLPPGWYEVELIVSSRGQSVGDQRLDLIVLADNATAIAPDDRFGVVATDLPFAAWGELPDILPMLGAGRLKLAVWSGTGDVQQIDAAAFDQVLVRLQEMHVMPTGCLVDLPPAIAEKLLARQRLVEASRAFTGAPPRSPAPDSAWHHLLKASPEDWEPQLAQLIARHANHLQRWQLGADGTDAFVTQPGMREVYDKVYQQFAALVNKPDLAMPWPAWYELDGRLPAAVALSIPSSILPSQIPLYIQDVRGSDAKDAHQFSITLQPLERRKYGREAQIRDFAQRIVYALAADARRIDVPLPFAATADEDGDARDVAERPQELFMILRTLVATLGGAAFKGKVPIAEGVEAFLFERQGQGIIVLWDRGNTPGPKQLPLNLGDRPMRVDLWGNVTPVLNPADRKAAGNTQFTIGPMPVILLDIDAELALLRASINIDRPLVESSFQVHTRRLRFGNPFKTAISGTVRLKAPAGWTLNPPTHSFSLNPGETYDGEITIEFPYNSYAGPKTIEAQFAVQADKASTFDVPLTLQLGLSDVGMQTLALRDGNDVMVQQTIQNYGDRPIDYGAFAILPGQARQERLVTNLGAGRSTIKRYRFTNVKLTKGLKIRVGVKEISGSRILNDEVEIQ